MRRIPESELLINPDGSIFHLHLHPDQLADCIVMMGDPARVDMVASLFDSRQCEVQNREFRTITGTYRGKRITALSHGIGGDNIDIVINELDALVNIDLVQRIEKVEKRSLSIVRIGTSGSLQPDVPLGAHLISSRSIGFDGVLNFYAGRDEVCDLAFEKKFCEFTRWSPQHAAPYVVSADRELLSRLNHGDMVNGVTVSANGFYGPQGRHLRLPLADDELNHKIEAFRYGEEKITNYEMEGAALAGLARLLGHHAVTVCDIIAGRTNRTANVNYKGGMAELIKKVLERI
ncbi:MAG: nucleoside phosphorylase [Bacteroidales bacterium]